MESRKTYNEKCLNILKFNDKFNKALIRHDNLTYFFDKTKKMINNHPEQRFGQILCNYILPNYQFDLDYADDKDNELMNIVFENYFNDPFFEESIDTYNRLKQIDESQFRNNII